MDSNIFATPVSRRTIAKGAAWSVPALVVANTAHAAECASPPCDDEQGPVVIGDIRDACKYPGESQGGKGYHVVVCWDNSGDQGAHVTVTDVNADGGAITGYEVVPATFFIGPNDTQCANIEFDSTNSANLSMTIEYTVVLEDGTVYENSRNVYIADFPPCPKGTRPE